MNRKRVFQILILLFMLSVYSCSKEPQPSISQEKMVDILVDLHISEAAAMTLNRNTKDSILRVYYGQIFQIHEVDSALFFSEFELLRKDPKKLETYYKKVFEEVEQLGSERVNEEKPVEKKK